MANDTGKNRPYGVPKTEAEREAAHAAKYGTTTLPPRGTGYNGNPGNPGTKAYEAEREMARTGNGFDKTVTPELIARASLVADLLTIKVNDLRPWYETGSKKAAADATDVIYSKRCRPAQIIVLTHISAKAATNATTTTELAIERGGELIVLNRDVPSAADISVDWDGQAILAEGDRVRVYFSGATSTNLLDVSFSGYEIKA